MADLGIRGNVMGPQPIAQAKPLPPAMLEAAEHVFAMLERGEVAELVAMSTPSVAGAIEVIASAIQPGLYNRHEIIAHARVIQHYYIKGRLLGDGGEPFTIQFRLGEKDGAWLIWEVLNLTGGRAAWTR
ncbi:MAG: hypothetical protein ABSG46_10835 [Candidatus Binataceae bacterium]|jgi:hypothetical protein